VDPSITPTHKGDPSILQNLQGNLRTDAKVETGSAKTKPATNSGNETTLREKLKTRQHD